MKLKVKQSLIYCGIVYNPGEVVDILESDIIERVKSLELVEAEEVTEEAENLEGTEEVTEEAENLEGTEETTEENTEVEETNKNSKKSKKA
jgi:hypothetical protein|nr:MAG TPA: hypothetical protein [Caudoviricetes sp.]